MLKNLWCKNLKHYFVLMHWSVVLARVSHCVMENKVTYVVCECDVFSLIFRVNIILWNFVWLVLSSPSCLSKCMWLSSIVFSFVFRVVPMRVNIVLCNYVMSFLVPPFSYPFHPVSFLPSFFSLSLFSPSFLSVPDIPIVQPCPVQDCTTPRRSWTVLSWTSTPKKGSSKLASMFSPSLSISTSESVSLHSGVATPGHLGSQGMRWFSTRESSFFLSPPSVSAYPHNTCMHVCVHDYTPTHICIQTYSIFIHSHAHTYMYTYMHVCTWLHTHIHTCIHNVMY